MQVLSQAIIAPTPLDFERMDAICRRLPPFPPLASQLIEHFSRPDADLMDAVALIRSDAVFSGELLRLANSAEFTSYEVFEDVARAVLYLGFERVQSAIRRITYARLMKDSFNHPLSGEIHRNNMATAYLCERLMECYGEGGEADGVCPYSLGLYLKIGALVLLRGFPRDYPRFLSARVANETELLASERAMFGFSHIEVSTHLVKHWEFPDGFQTLVTQHAEPAEIRLPLTSGNAARLAARMSGALGYAFLKSLSFAPFDSLVSSLPDCETGEFSKNAGEWRSRIDAHLEALSVDV
ncbi:MAG: HDOD domain-containing protein [Bryobacterales bacterium]|nr:HDOD domain-containing protein [Bryobacterales bacterium]